MLLPDVCGVLGELPAGGATANQRPLPLFLFRIHCCLSTERSGARGDSAERGHAAAKRAGAGRARVLGGGYFENQSDSGAACRNQHPAFGGKRADSGGKRAEA